MIYLPLFAHENGYRVCQPVEMPQHQQLQEANKESKTDRNTLKKAQNAQECDATGPNSSIAARLIKNILMLFRLIPVMNCNLASN